MGKSLEVVEVVLVQYKLVANQYQHKSEVLSTFTPDKSYAYALTFEPSNLLFLKTYSPKCDGITITFTDQNVRPLEIGKVIFTLLVNKWKWNVILKNQEQENTSNDMDFCNSREIYPTNMGKNYWILLQKQDQILQCLLIKK